MARRHYSDEERAAALAALKANGGNLELTAKQAGVPRNTLRGWAEQPDRAAPSELRQEKVESYADLYDQVTRAYLGRALDPDVVGKTSGKDAVVAAATATDKHRLLTGQGGTDGRLSITVIEVHLSRPEPLTVGPAIEIADAGTDRG
jgi:hypothetical protein